MASRDPDTAAGVMVALYCVLVAACLAAALALPSGIQIPRRVGISISVLALIGIPVLLRIAERSRIRAAVNERGGTVLKLRRLPFWRQGWDYYCRRTVAPKYEVVFSDLTGRRLRTICRSGFLRGVEWLDTIEVQA